VVLKRVRPDAHLNGVLPALVGGDPLLVGHPDVAIREWRLLPLGRVGALGGREPPNPRGGPCPRVHHRPQPAGPGNCRQVAPFAWTARRRTNRSPATAAREQAYPEKSCCGRRLSA